MKESVQIRKVQMDERSISYEFRRKNVKNINLRVRTDGSVAVSASARVPLAMVDAFVQRKAKLIFEAQRRLAEKQETPSLRQYVTGETVWYLGRALCLEVREWKASGGEICGDRLILTVPANADVNSRRRIFERFWGQQSLLVFAQLMKRQYPIFQVMGVAEPTLKVRNMRSRWGSCHTTKGIITLSSQLLERSAGAIEYVILHEYCHLIHPNHSKDFHSLVEKLMPDWRERKALLSMALPDIPRAVQQEG